VSIREASPHSFLKRDAALELLDVGFAAEDEQVADLLEIDLPSRPPAEVAERVQAAPGDLDVQCVRELSAYATRRSARGAAPELRPLDERDIDARLGQVEGGAGADHAATDDDHVGGLRKR
jgi:hypothetical protein